MRLSVCSLKKVRWYLERGLADSVEHPDDGCGPPGEARRVAIRLRFAPGGLGHSGDPFYLEPKLNRCCVCGAADSYVRHAVVPRNYRQHFPTAMKSHLSHDVVLLCPACHKRANEGACARAAALGAQLGVPPEHEAVEPQLLHDPARVAAQRSARALQLHDAGGGGGGGKKARRQKAGAGLPAERRLEHLRALAGFYGLPAPSDVSATHIEAACALETAAVNPRWVPHGQLVVERLGGEEGIAEFVKGWRLHFVQSMRPAHLSANWSVDARVANATAAVFGGKERALNALAAADAARAAAGES